ncbi:unnamed protein product, partial [Durusdinium trenchii]
MPKLHWGIFMLVPGLAQKFSCTSTTDTKGVGLDVLQTETTNTDFCSEMPTTDTVGELVDSCAAFCGGGNIPLLVGIPSYGFSHSDIDKVCLADDNSLAQYNASHMNNCRAWSQALQLINTRAAGLVAALENMTMAQLNFKAGIALKSKELAATMASDQTKDRLLSVTSSQTASEYRTILEAGVSDFLSSGKYRRDLQDTMEVLRNAGRTLDAALSSNLPQLRKFVDLCGDLLVSTGGTFGITGETGTPPQNSTGRRLQTAGGPVDVCAEAEVVFKDDKSQRYAELQSTAEGNQLLQAHLSALATAYPDFYSESNCRSSRRLDAAEQEPEVQEGGGGGAGEPLERI